uniref:Uncharacterized protein n=1 Tax=Arundo donax TaxID=35708 RepID=A0A0A8Z3H0_ARUDO
MVRVDSRIRFRFVGNCDWVQGILGWIWYDWECFG